MSTVIADTSALQYLHQLDRLKLLHDVLGPATIPQAVAQELAEGRRVGVNVPDPANYPWLIVQRVGSTLVLPLAWDLGRGEREVLALALETTSALVVLDDGLARRAARHLGVPMVGTLGLLLAAKNRGMIPAVQPLLDQLEQLNFRVDPETRRHILRMAGEST